MPYGTFKGPAEGPVTRKKVLVAVCILSLCCIAVVTVSTRHASGSGAQLTALFEGDDVSQSQEYSAYNDGSNSAQAYWKAPIQAEPPMQHVNWLSVGDAPHSPESNARYTSLSSYDSSRSKDMIKRAIAYRADANKMQFMAQDNLRESLKLHRMSRYYAAQSQELKVAASGHKKAAKTQLAALKGTAHLSQLASVKAGKASATYKSLQYKSNQLLQKGNSNKMTARSMGMRATQEYNKAKDDEDALDRGQQLVAQMQKAIKAEKQTQKSSKKLANPMMRKIVINGSKVRMAQEYNQLALGKYRIQKAGKYKRLGRAIMTLAKKDTAASHQLMAKAREQLSAAEHLYEQAMRARAASAGSLADQHKTQAVLMAAHQKATAQLLTASSFKTSSAKMAKVSKEVAAKSVFARRLAKRQLEQRQRLLSAAALLTKKAKFTALKAKAEEKREVDWMSS